MKPPTGRSRRPARAGRPSRRPAGGPDAPPAGRPVERATAARLAELDEVEITIEKLVAGGEGLGRVEGIPLFVPRSAPGDRARVRIVERHRDFGRAEVVALLAPGPDRRDPPCRHFARCGGCDLQHLTDEAQLRAKAAAALETLRRLGGIETPPSLRVVSGRAWGYRLRTQLQVERAADGAARVGYHARRSNDLIEVDSCPVLVPELEEALRDLPAALRGIEALPRRLDLAAGGPPPGGGAAPVTVAPSIGELPHGAVTLRAAGFEFEFDARGFFQGHRDLVPDLLESVIGGWEGETAFDLYSGVGLFALPLARRYGRVLGVESDVGSVRHARHNARRNGVRSVEFETCSVEGWIRRLPHGADRVVVDPPRAGLPLLVRRLLVDRAPARLTYVSCHVAAAARDLREMAGAFALEAIDLVDLFPQTGHIELVAQLARRPPVG